MASIRFNPFRPETLVGPELFAGRLPELKTLEHVLFQTKNRNPAHFMIRGERGIGKSSLLLFLKYVAQGTIRSAHDNQYHFLVASIKLEPNSTYGEIIKRVGAELQREVTRNDRAKALAKKAIGFLAKWEIMGVKYSSEMREPEPYELLDDLSATIDITFQTLKADFDGILITIDEADKPPPSSNLGGFSKLLSERLMMKGCDQVVLGISGLPQTVDRLREGHESAPRVFKDIYLHPLPPDERIDAVRRGLIEAKKFNAVETRITPEAETMISEFTEGYPHFIQQFAYSAFDADTDYLIGEDDVKAGAFLKDGAFHQLGVKYFQDQYFDQIGSDDYRRVLRAMAEHFDEWVTKTQIRDVVNLKEKTLDNAISALKKRNIIIAKPGNRGEYRLPSRSFAVWIKAYTSNGH